MKTLIIIGDGETAELAQDYFLKDTNYKIECHAVDSNFKTKNKLGNYDVITLEELEKNFLKDDVCLFVAIGSNKLNAIRTKYYEYFKKKNYSFASYVSSKAFVWHDAKIGDNAFILENNVIQKNCVIGNNVTLWSGNHIGHRSKIGDNVFITSHVVISGFCNLGKNTFLGVNSTVINNIDIGESCFINASSNIKFNLKSFSSVNPKSAEISKISTKKLFKI
ncbi:acetyltransferase [Candidatus Pelagibacter communis]|uniref:acetyltransferase n=1 Tax=Pelagibacter ubique TaxID=198252 RepID=UPI000B055140|nr:acetyltransferase [Candidatus Pelagibacter ubique]